MYRRINGQVKFPFYGRPFFTMLTWEIEARRILKAELARAGVNYRALVAKLAALGIEETEANLSNKINRGKFSFAFFLQCMRALGITTLDVRTASETTVAKNRK